MSSIPFIMLEDKNSAAPLYRQIYEAIRRSILSGEFASRMRLPASRLLAKQLGVSRMTVINAYEQLFAEGYLEGKIGAGTFVAAHLPEDFLHTPRVEQPAETKKPARELNISDFGKHLARDDYAVMQSQRPGKFQPFLHGITAFDKFPFDIWGKISQKWYRRLPPDLLGYGDLAGFEPLRESIAAHLEAARGVKCTAQQVIITNGTQQAVDLISRILLNPHDEVWMEEPCYRGARDIFTSMGAHVSHIDVDYEGFNVELAQKQANPARLVYVTPSHQFPLGVTMSLQRRLSLLEWASENDAWIIEDDYNSEFRYAGRPLASLQGLDRNGRVIYIGTFSKTIFPALRLGCLVLPADLVEIFTAGRALTDVHSPIINQAVLADFIAEGHFGRHLRRMRALYEERQEILVTEIKKQLGGILKIEPAESGMHLIGWLPSGVNDREISHKALELNVNITALSAYRNRESPHNGLVFGYTAFDEKQIKQGVAKLRRVFDDFGF